MAEPHSSRDDATGEAVVSVVAYIEVRPTATAEAAAVLKRYRDASRSDTGFIDLQVLQQRGRPDHFALVERWQGPAAVDFHQATAHTQHFRQQLESFRLSPYDERPHHGLIGGLSPRIHDAAATFVLTHADAIPPAKDEAIAALQQLAAVSRQDDGNLGFAVLQQHSRANHFTIVEIWKDQQAQEAHTLAAHTYRFREQFQPMSGSLYDERLYQPLD